MSCFSATCILPTYLSVNLSVLSYSKLHNLPTCPVCKYNPVYLNTICRSYSTYLSVIYLSLYVSISVSIYLLCHFYTPICHCISTNSLLYTFFILKVIRTHTQRIEEIYEIKYTNWWNGTIEQIIRGILTYFVIQTIQKYAHTVSYRCYCIYIYPHYHLDHNYFKYSRGQIIRTSNIEGCVTRTVQWAKIWITAYKIVTK